MKKSNLDLNRSSRAVNNPGSGIHQVSQSSKHFRSVTGSQSRIRSILVGGSKPNGPKRSTSQAPTRQVLDDDGNDVTPLPLCDANQEDRSKPVFLDEIFSNSEPDFTNSTSSFSVVSASSFMGRCRPPSLSRASLTDDSVPKLDTLINPPPPYEVPLRRENVKQHVTEEMLDEVVDVYLTETDTISLQDMPSTLVSEDADDAGAIKERNLHYAELCKNSVGNDKYVKRPMQTFTGAPKDKQTQKDEIVMVDEGTIATIWDIYDSFQNETPENEKADYPERTVKTVKGQEKRGEKSTSGSTYDTGSTLSSLLYCPETEMCGDSLNADPDPQIFTLSESFQHSLLVMERSVVGNLFQPKLASYRQLTVLDDPDSTVKSGTEEPSVESSSSPTLDCLLTFSCELTEQCNITSMTWNKENPDLLAVSYGDIDSSSQKASLICCWSLKNPTWPERVFHCHSCVTSLDFSANSPNQLAVGMFDGTVAIYDVQSPSNKTCIADSSKCSKKHLHPVWQVNWTKQEMGLSGEDWVEVLVSVSADGRIANWLFCNNSLDCTDLMTIKRAESGKKKDEGKKKKKKTGSALAALTPGLCIDFHPTGSSIYLVGTGDGLIHKCSLSNSLHFLQTYKQHFCPVNHIEWSPFSPDVFLSCSSDWTIQLWNQDRLTPMLSFTSTQKAVHAVRWSPKWSTVFAAINGRQLQIWDLNFNLLNPATVLHAAPGVEMTSLLFAKEADCVLVGDSDGQVTVYQLNNLSAGEGKQVDSLDDIIHPAVSK